MSNMYKRTKNDPRLTKGRKQRTRGFFLRLKNPFSNRGTNPWKVNLTKKSKPWARILAPILILTIPLLVIMTVDNGLLRLPDVYKYHLLSNDVLGERMVAADPDKVSQLMSDYMLHKTDRFQMKEDLEYMPADVFTKADGGMMQSLRSIIDIQAVVGFIALLLTLLLIIFIIKKKERDLLLQSFYYSLPAFVIMKAIGIAMMMFQEARFRVFGISTVDAAVSEDLIPSILDDAFFRFLAMAQVAVSLVFLGLIYYLVLNLSGRKTTFRR
jgi:uncharacterized integral membrane protein